MKRRLFLLAALTLCAAFVFAQGAGPGGQGAPGGQRQGRGQGQRGFGMVQRGGFAQSEVQLAMRKDVQADLKVTAEQVKKLEELAAKQREARQGVGRRNRGGQPGGGQPGGQPGGGQPGSNVDRDALRRMMEQQREETRKALAEILDAGHVKRLGEISLQLRGSRALLDPEVQKALGLSEDQAGKLRDLQRKQGEANQAILEKARNQEISREEAQASLEKNNKVLEEEMLKILTAEQAGKLKMMQGAPFKADPNEGGRRGGGRIG
jgi:hypothetical protein